MTTAFQKAIPPHEKALEVRYEALSDRQKQFFEYLVEKRDYYLRHAIELAENLKDNDKIIEPRLAEIIERFDWETIEDIIELKSCLRRYRSDYFDDGQRAIIWFRVLQWNESFKEAIDNVYRNDDTVRLIGYWTSEFGFGEELVKERDYLSGYSFADVYEFFISDRNKEKTLYNLPESIIDMVDFVKVAEQALYGWHGGAGLSNYYELDDPEYPSKWAFFQTY